MDNLKLDTSLITHDVKICINPDCGVVVLNKNWKETSCRDCEMRLVKINAKCFKTKFLKNKQIIYLEI